MDDLVQRKQLIKYLPDFMKQFREFQEIMRVEDLQFDRMDWNLQAVLNNAFIADADEYGIKKYEKMLGIMPSADDTLESRRSRVLLRWDDKIPYTYQVLIAKLNMVCGVNHYDLEGDLTRYEIKIHTHLDSSWKIEELEDLLLKILPMNIHFEIKNTIPVYGIGHMHIACATFNTICYKLSEGEVF